MSERTISVAEAARDFASLVDEASKRNECVVLLKDGAPVAKIVPLAPRRVTGRELAESWSKMHHLTPEDAADFEAELEAAKKMLIPPISPWD